MSPRLSSLHELTALFPTDVHDQNFIHTDLKPENILLEDATFDTIIRVSCPLTSTADPRAHASTLAENKRQAAEDAAEYEHSPHRFWKRYR